jgi:hypothetical protein
MLLCYPARHAPLVPLAEAVVRVVLADGTYSAGFGGAQGAQGADMIEDVVTVALLG